MAAKTHPVEATPDHPLFTCGGKRGEKIKMEFTLFAAKPERGSASEALPG